MRVVSAGVSVRASAGWRYSSSRVDPDEALGLGDPAQSRVPSGAVGQQPPTVLGLDHRVVALGPQPVDDDQLRGVQRGVRERASSPRRLDVRALCGAQLEQLGVRRRLDVVPTVRGPLGGVVDGLAAVLVLVEVLALIEVPVLREPHGASPTVSVSSSTTTASLIRTRLTSVRDHRRPRATATDRPSGRRRTSARTRRRARARARRRRRTASLRSSTRAVSRAPVASRSAPVGSNGSSTELGAGAVGRLAQRHLVADRGGEDRRRDADEKPVLRLHLRRQGVVRHEATVPVAVTAVA